MKTKRRHELQTNYLSDWINKQLEVVQPFSKVFLGVVIVLAAALASWGIFVSQRGKKESESWMSFYEARNTADSGELLQVAVEYPDTIAAIWAKQQAADILLERGQRLLYGQSASRAQATDDIEMAVGLFEDVIVEVENRGEDTTFIQQRAHFGAAVGYECLRNNLPKAVEQYETIIKKWPDSALAEAAQEQINKITSEIGRENQAWILSHSPAPPDPFVPRSRPGFGEGFDSGFGIPSDDSPESLLLPTLEERLGSGEGEDNLGGLFEPSNDDEETTPDDGGETVPDDATSPPTTDDGDGAAPAETTAPPTDIPATDESTSSEDTSPAVDVPPEGAGDP